ncbi:DUF1826 domain-containing protein [Pseudoalteromonas sp. NEC-BIFX-2020_002]|uniref:DUF1826 domain-containing protein n=1 Tax=Pseudoalteromonas sp. NEC-BIFX-2020_002 TaxID=2732353 RepID=UPI0014775C92|nr:DUF1826 domain-containing protein [Pseudoalteromonas sp. NEC-BIFX-2020_002]NNG41517.1 DUF1826 domain-containing protein [Pseudoalteromonas sp. NEC-BIFX-2020_002]
MHALLSQEQTVSPVYSIDTQANVLSQIYNLNTVLACYCCKSSWALSTAAKKYAQHSQGELIRYQGGINPKLYTEVEQLFNKAAHGDLISAHIKQMLSMFEVLFEPKEIGIRVISCDHAISPAFHKNTMITRMASSVGGTGEQWIEHSNATFLPLVGGQLTHQIKPPEDHVINHFCDGDIAIYKGTNWLAQEHNALITSSPAFINQDPRICIYIDYIC